MSRSIVRLILLMNFAEAETTRVKRSFCKNIGVNRNFMSKTFER